MESSRLLLNSLLSLHTQGDHLLKQLINVLAGGRRTLYELLCMNLLCLALALNKSLLDWRAQPAGWDVHNQSGIVPRGMRQHRAPPGSSGGECRTLGEGPS